MLNKNIMEPLKIPLKKLDELFHLNLMDESSSSGIDTTVDEDIHVTRITGLRNLFISKMLPTDRPVDPGVV